MTIEYDEELPGVMIIRLDRKVVPGTPEWYEYLRKIIELKEVHK